MKEYTNSEGIFSKIQREEQAIAIELKRYKAHYSVKNSETKDVGKFLQMIKYLNVLLLAHCKNTILITP